MRACTGAKRRCVNGLGLLRAVGHGIVPPPLRRSAVHRSVYVPREWRMCALTCEPREWGTYLDYLDPCSGGSRWRQRWSSREAVSPASCHNRRRRSSTTCCRDPPALNPPAPSPPTLGPPQPHRLSVRQTAWRSRAYDRQTGVSLKAIQLQFDQQLVHAARPICWLAAIE